MAAPTSHTPVETSGSLTRKHAVRCESFDNFTVEQYVTSMAMLVGDESIIAASRMNKSVVIFLSSLDAVEMAIINGLFIDNQMIDVAHMIKPATKVILSNVPPYIPNQLITKELEQYGQVVGRFRAIPLGCKAASLKHVMSFRRQGFILLRGGTGNINGLIRIMHDGHPYNIYLSTDEMKCFGCMETGHLRKNCPHANGNNDKNVTPKNNNENTNQNINDNITDASQNVNTTGSASAQPIRASNNDSKTTGGLNDSMYANRKPLPKDNRNQSDNGSTEADKTTLSVSTNDTTKPTAVSTTDALSTTDDDTNVSAMSIDPFDKSSSSCDEERVRTPPSPHTYAQAVGSPTTNAPAEEVPQVFAIPDTPIDFDLSPQDDNVSCCETESTCSEMSEMSEVSHTDGTKSLNSITDAALKVFLTSTLHSKKFIADCYDFHPNLKVIVHHMNKYRQTHVPNTSQKARILKLINKIKMHIKTTGRNFDTRTRTKKGIGRILVVEGE